MAFTAYWKTTTGFNTQDYPVTIGKRLNQCSLAELTAHPLCGSNSIYGNITFAIKSSDLGYSSVARDLTGGAMFKEPITNTKANEQANEPAQVGNDALVYRRTIFIAYKTNVSIPQHAIDDTCSNDIYIVENITAPNKLVYNFTGASGMGTSDGGIPTVRIGGYQLRHTCQKSPAAYASAPNQLVYTDNTDPNNPVTTNYNLCLAFVYVVGNDAFVLIDDHVGNFGFRYKANDVSNQYNWLDNGLNYKSFNSTNNYRLFIGMNPNATGRDATLAEIFPNCFADPVPDPAEFVNTYYVTNVQTNLVQTLKFKFLLSHGDIVGVSSRTLQFTLSGDTALEARMQQMCRGGIHFVFNGDVWKPLITGGIVVGYGSLEQESELDKYNDLNHPVPTSGGGGGGVGGDVSDKEVSMPTRMLSGSAGMVTYYEINKSGTATANQISEAISRFDITTIGKDLMRNLISFKAFALLPVSLFNNIIHIAGRDLKDANDNYLTGDVITAVNKINLGSITVPTLYNDYRDYAPYTKIEMYVPLCGWFTLPEWVIGKSVSGEMFVDIYNGTVKAVIKASSTVVAEVGGNAAYDIPFVAESTGMKAGAVISSALNTAVSAGMFATAPTVHTGTAALSSAANLASSLNTNATTLKGVLGDGSNVNGLTSVYIKVTRPKSPNEVTDIPEKFKQNHGIPCMQQLTLAAGDGFTQVLEPDVSGTMTAAEKQMIIDGFRHGLIISANPT